MRKIAANYILLPGIREEWIYCFERRDGGGRGEYRGRDPGNSLSRILWGDAC